MRVLYDGEPQGFEERVLADESLPWPTEPLLVAGGADIATTGSGGCGTTTSAGPAAGLPVPPGFHVTTAAYRRFVAANGLQPMILAAASRVRADDPASLDEAA